MEESQEQVHAEAHALFMNLMENIPPELKYQLLLEALQGGGPELLVGLEDARDAILFHASVRNPALLGTVNDYVNSMLAEDGPSQGRPEGASAFGDDEESVEGSDGEDDELPGRLDDDEEASDGDDDADFEADLAFARQVNADLLAKYADQGLPQPPGSGRATMFAEDELKAYAESAFAEGPRRMRRPAPPGQQSNEFSASFLAHATHSGAAPLSGTHAYPPAGAPLSGHEASDASIRAFVQQLLRPGPAAPELHDGFGVGVGHEEDSSETRRMQAEVQEMYHCIVADGGIRMEGELPDTDIPER